MGVYLSKAVDRNVKADLYLDLAELISGLLLVGFLWTHMIFVGFILLGPQYFDALARFLDDYYLSYIGIPFIGVVAAVHVLVVARRFPMRYRLFWHHVRLINHFDTWTWVFQVITAVGIFFLASIHVFIILTDWPIQAAKSALRINSPMFWFYVVLLLLGEYHAGMGLYRQFVKWGWLKRRSVSAVLKIITGCIIILGLAALIVFKQVAEVIVK